MNFVDLRDKKPGELAPGGSTLEECPTCGLAGLRLIGFDSNGDSGIAYAHVVAPDIWAVIEGCSVKYAGKA